MVKVNWRVDEWEGCYPSNWKGLIVPQAISHPAKFSSRLIRRIYDHILEEGWVKEGDTVIDPFGGVALGALDALRVGLRWRGCELESRFAELGAWNISHWNIKFRMMPKWSRDAVLYQGDSRHLLDVLSGRAQGAVSSPPYADGAQHTGGNDLHPEKIQGGTYFGVGITGAVSSPPYAEARIGKESGQGQCGRGDQYGETDGQLGAMKAGSFETAVSSPPYNLPMSQTHNGRRGGNRGTTPSEDGAFVKYGNTDGQLEGLPMTEENFKAAISSPPYTGSIQVEKNSNSIDRSKQYEAYKASGGGQSFEAFCRTQELHSQGYGTSEGQLGVMPNGDFQAAISSPPFRQSEGGTPEPKPGGTIDERLYARHAAGNSAAEGYGATDGQLANMGEGDFQSAVSSPPFESVQGFHDKEFSDKWGHKQVRTAEPLGYGETEGNIGNDSGDDFWLAARQIVEQVYLALEPGGHAVWVCKNFVKDKKVVEFSDQWRQLCEAVGFKTLHWHKAMLVHRKGTSINFEGEHIEHKSESKSFFRRLAEKKGSPRVDWEDILCMVKE